MAKERSASSCTPLVHLVPLVLLLLLLLANVTANTNAVDYFSDSYEVKDPTTSDNDPAYNLFFGHSVGRFVSQPFRFLTSSGGRRKGGRHPPGRGRHPPGVGKHPPGVGKHPPGVGKHPPGVGKHKPRPRPWFNNFLFQPPPPPQIDNGCCIGKPDGYFADLKTDTPCSRFCECVNGSQVILQACPYGLLFNEEALECDVPSRDVCPQAFPPSPAPPPEANAGVLQGGLVPPENSEDVQYETRNEIFRYQSISKNSLPSSVDWRNTSLVKFQAACDSCWAFVVTGAVESIQSIVNKRSPTSLSEQQLIDCSSTGDGCLGGWPDTAMDYVVKNGLASEEDYPYKADSQSCDESKIENPSARISAFETVPALDTESLQKAVANQPVIVKISAANVPSFRSYRGGIYYGTDSTGTYDCDSIVDHAVLLVGYGYEIVSDSNPPPPSSPPPSPTSSLSPPSSPPSTSPSFPNPFPNPSETPPLSSPPLSDPPLLSPPVSPPPSDSLSPSPSDSIPSTFPPSPPIAPPPESSFPDPTPPETAIPPAYTPGEDIPPENFSPPPFPPESPPSTFPPIAFPPEVTPTPALVSSSSRRLMQFSFLDNVPTSLPDEQIPSPDTSPSVSPSPEKSSPPITPELTPVAPPDSFPLPENSPPLLTPPSLSPSPVGFPPEIPSPSVHPPTFFPPETPSVDFPTFPPSETPVQGPAPSVEYPQHSPSETPQSPPSFTPAFPPFDGPSYVPSNTPTDNSPLFPSPEFQPSGSTPSNNPGFPSGEFPGFSPGFEPGDIPPPAEPGLGPELPPVISPSVPSPSSSPPSSSPSYPVPPLPNSPVPSPELGPSEFPPYILPPPPPPSPPPPPVPVGFKIVNYWIIKNSWGPEWGEGGYMRIARTDGVGICNMNSLPAIYPVTSSGCNGPNPCGGGTCVPGEGTDYFCVCPPGYTNVDNTDGTQTCAVADVCLSTAYSPCGFGTCIPSGSGTYKCDCPPGFLEGKNVAGAITCILPSLEKDSSGFTYTTSSTDTCTSVSAKYSLTVLSLCQINPPLCSTGQCVLPPSPYNVTVGPIVSQSSCGLWYVMDKGENCPRITRNFNLTEARLKAFNGPDFDCSNLQAGHSICIQEGSSAIAPQCQTYKTVKSRETCGSIIYNTGLSFRVFFALNPGLLCSNLSPGDEVCVYPAQGNLGAGSSLQVVGGGKCRRYRRVRKGDSCLSIAYRCTHGSLPLLWKLNGGVQCRDNKLIPGYRLCVCWWGKQCPS